MGILEKLGLAPKRREGAPVLIGERRKKQEEAASRKQVWLRWIIFMGFLILTVYAIPQTSFRHVSNYSIGDPWREDDLVAPFTFALQKTQEELEAERDEVRRNTPPIFHLDENARESILSRIHTLYQEMQPVLDSYVQWQRARITPGVSPEPDSLRYLRLKQESQADLTDATWNILLNDYAVIRISDLTMERYVGTRIRTALEATVESLLNAGIINVYKRDITSEELTLRNLGQRTERTVSLSSVRDLPEASEYALSRFSRVLENRHVAPAMELFERVIQANWVFSTQDTQLRLSEALAEISTTKGAVAQGQVIIRRGDITTEETANILRSLAEVRAETATRMERWLRYAGDAIVVIVASIFFLFYLFLYRKKIFEHIHLFLLVFLVMGIVVATSSMLYGFDQLSVYLIPVAIAPLLLTIIFDSRVGLMATITLAIITAVYNDNNFEYMVATILACSFGILSVRDINKRTQFFVTTPLVVFLGYFLIISGFALTRQTGWEGYAGQLLTISINAIFILFTYPLILLFEKTFSVTTDFTLLELADTNLPLLKEMMNKAPGTFHHSLQVANLAEAAASAIGANALLCRVGALYHDIGKVEKPAYFIENQSGHNEHDKLKARMSALIIKAHVTDGIRLAEEHGLPEVIVRFIRTHHGTSLIRFFYEKAKKESPDTEVREEDFRYDGPLPETREEGILLLADGIEAASRSMKDPTYTKLENLINRMVDDHISEGQLNHCPLTFHQIDIIKKTFLNILVGVYHSRVEYPDERDAKDAKGENVGKGDGSAAGAESDGNGGSRSKEADGAAGRGPDVAEGSRTAGSAGSAGSVERGKSGKPDTMTEAAGAGSDTNIPPAEKTGQGAAGKDRD